MNHPDIVFEVKNKHVKTGYRTKTEYDKAILEPQEVDGVWRDVLNRLPELLIDEKKARVPNDMEAGDILNEIQFDENDTLSFEKAIGNVDDVEMDDVEDAYEQVTSQREEEQTRQQARDRLEFTVNNTKHEGGEAGSQYAVVTMYDSEIDEERTYRYYCLFGAGHGYQRVDGSETPDLDEVMLKENAPITNHMVMTVGKSRNPNDMKFDPVQSPDEGAENKSEYLYGVPSDNEETQETPIVQDNELHCYLNDFEDHGDFDWLQVVTKYDKHTKYSWDGWFIEDDEDEHPSQVPDDTLIRTSEGEFFQFCIDGDDWTAIWRDEDWVRDELGVVYDERIDEFLSFRGYAKLEADALNEPVYIQRKSSSKRGVSTFQLFNNLNVRKARMRVDRDTDSINLTVTEPVWDGSDKYRGTRTTFTNGSKYDLTGQVVTVQNPDFTELTSEAVEQLEMTQQEVVKKPCWLELETGDGIEVKYDDERKYGFERVDIGGDMEAVDAKFKLTVENRHQQDAFLTCVIKRDGETKGSKYVVRTVHEQIETVNDKQVVPAEQLGDPEDGWVQEVYDYDHVKYKYGYKGDWINDEVVVDGTVLVRNSADEHYVLTEVNDSVNIEEVSESEFKSRVQT